MKKIIIYLGLIIFPLMAYSQVYVEDKGETISFSAGTDTIVYVKSKVQLYLQDDDTQVLTIGVDQGYRTKKYFECRADSNGFASIAAFKAWAEIIMSADYRFLYSYSSGNMIEKQYVVRTLYDTIVEGKDTLTYSGDTLLTFDYINLDR